MSEQELAVIKERADKATVGPWFYEGERVSSENGRGVFSILNEQYIYGNDYDLRFIEHAREDIPKLVAEVERLQNKLSLHTLGKRNLDVMIAHKDEEIARLRKALEFYANEEIYENPILHEDEDGTLHCDHSDAELDNGKRAREALE